ncbi:phosphomevalonate kinase [Moniliophthora roreri]|uniref:Phosphomevalonate kinase n=1 Tax=Moniliophthora roreri TaxID=221103 RepID=A0A0W0G4Z6_MONRR|nr:phosphomevalonate kinase [Moniliophthora roreri]
MATVVSSPGKVLIAGGYLVLDPKYSGVVVSTSSRFYTVIQSHSAPGIRVRSPQFDGATWVYNINFESGVVGPSSTNTSKNKFVHLALQETISLAIEAKGSQVVSEKLGAGLDIAIVGDNDFYSQRAKLESLNLPRTLTSLAHIPPFTPLGVPLAGVHKTGLGSSAALITSLVSALLLHLGVIPSLSEEKDRQLAHNTAQYIHCLAQGKVGSGFDVSAAVFGSHIYTRFEPGVINGLMSDSAQKELLKTLEPTNKAWNHVIRHFALPPMTRLMLADVDAGSDTPSLVEQVLKWRKENPGEADALWDTIDASNQSLAQTLLRLNDLYEADASAYSQAVKVIASTPASEWSTLQGQVEKTFYEAYQTMQAIRAHMRQMGTLTGVPIEPVEQERLLDACVKEKGVVGGGVPGAGGYDAVWLLVFDTSSVVEGIDQLWAGYTELSVSPLSAAESKAKGVRVERLSDIKGLEEAVRV